MENTKTNLDLEVQQYSDFPEIPRKSALVTVVGRIDPHEVHAKLEGIAIMMGHGEPTPESEAETLRMAHLFKASPRLFEAVEVLQARLKAILETHSELVPKEEIYLAHGAIVDATASQISWRDAIKVSRGRGEWTEEMDEHWGEDVHFGPTVLP